MKAGVYTMLGLIQPKIDIYLPIPRCAVCNKPCDYMEGHYDAWHREYVFIARCHGKEDIRNIPDTWVLQNHKALMAGEIEMEDAFVGANSIVPCNTTIL